MALETTRQKVSRMFSPETLKKFDNAGLMLVDKSDFETSMADYQKAVTENRVLRVKLKRLEKGE